MATWGVEPNEGVEITGNLIKFPKNTGTTDVVYTITYTDDNGCTANTTVKVQTGTTCQGCKYTVYSDVDGAKVELKYMSGEKITEKTIENGNAVFTEDIDSHTTLQVVVSKDGYTFQNGGVGRVSCNDDVTINKINNEINPSLTVSGVCPWYAFNTFQVDLDIRDSSTSAVVKSFQYYYLNNKSCTEQIKNFTETITQDSLTLDNDISNYYALIHMHGCHGYDESCQQVDPVNNKYWYIVEGTQTREPTTYGTFTLLQLENGKKDGNWFVTIIPNTQPI